MKIEEPKLKLSLRIKQISRKYWERYRSSRHKSRIILALIFVFFLIWGIFSMFEMYLGSLNLKRGFLEVSGRIEGYEYHAATKITGRIIGMFVEEGDFVEKGQPIGELSSEQIKAAYDAALAKWKLAELEFTHYSKVYEKKAMAKIEYDRIFTNYEIAKEELNRSRADLAETTIVAPISGRVITKILRSGEVVGAGTPLVTIINMDDLYLKVFLATDFAGKVNLGDEAKIFPDALPDKEFNAQVSKIAQKAQFTPKNVETKSQRAKLVFEIKLKVKENTDSQLKPGMPADGVIRVNQDASWKRYWR